MIGLYIHVVSCLIFHVLRARIDKHCYSQSEEILLNLGMKCWKGISNALYVASK
jgi:hypothetical protein